MMWEKYRIRFLWWAQISAKAVLFSIVSVLLSLSLLMTPASAQDNFSWKGEDIVYNNRTFSKQTVQDNSGKTFYVSKEGDKAHVLVFNGDAKQAKNASYSVYDVQDNHYSNPQNQQTVSLNSADGSNGQSTDSQNSCQIDGIGWIVCPMMKAISKEMDKMKDIIDKYMTVKRISTDKNSTLMQSWVIMRNIANILFIITFLIMIISYITSYGVTNYSIKKTLPRLIVGTILVNFSFYICVIAIDLTNIFGGSIADLFRSIQTQALNGGPNAQISWYEMTTQALAGGAIAVSGAMAASFAFGGLPGILLTLFAAIVGAAITLIVTVIILAGRQALILTLIIISPLAFVANLMPNTEIYFRKWLELLKKLLFIFPIFSVIYGGAQLAGWIIIKEASDAIILLLGMIVQIIPFLILPKLVKDSNTLLSQLGDGLNKTIFDPIRRTSTGYFDRKKAENRAQYLAEQPRIWEVPRRVSQALDRNKRLVEERTAALQKKAEARYVNTKNTAKGDNILNRYESTRILEEQANTELENAKLDTKITNKNLVAEMFQSIQKENDIKKGLKGRSKLEQDLAKAALLSRIKQSEETMATGAQAMNYNQMIQKKLDLGSYRGKKQDIIHASTGIFEGKEGTEVGVISKMLAATRKEYSEELSNYKTAMGVYKLSTDQLISIVMGDETTGYKPGKIIARDDAGNTYEFNGSEKAVWEAAAQKLFPYRIDLLSEYLLNTDKLKDNHGNFVKDSEGNDIDYTWRKKHTTQVANLIREYGLGKVATYLGNVSPELIEQGKIGEEKTMAIVLNQLVKGRFGSNEFISQDKDATEFITKIINKFKKMEFNIQPRDENGNIKSHDPNEYYFGDEKDLENAIGFGVDNLTKNKCIEGMLKYQKALRNALNPKGETFRQLKEAQIEKMRKLDDAITDAVNNHSNP